MIIIIEAARETWCYCNHNQQGMVASATNNNKYIYKRIRLHDLIPIMKLNCILDYQTPT